MISLFLQSCHAAGWDFGMWVTPPALGVLHQLPAPPKRAKLGVQMRLAALPNSIFYFFLSLLIVLIGIYAHTHTHPKSQLLLQVPPGKAAVCRGQREIPAFCHGMNPPKLRVCPQGGQGPVPSPAQGLPAPISCSRGWHVVTWLCLTCCVTLEDNDLEICANNCFDSSPGMSGFGLGLGWFFFFPQQNVLHLK